MNTMKMTLKWEMRKRFEGCKIFLLVLAIIIAVHSILPLPPKEAATDGILTLSILVFYLISGYLFLVYPITSLLNNFRGPYSILEQMEPRPFGQTLAVRILTALPISVLAFFAIYLECWVLEQLEIDFFSYVQIRYSFEDVVTKIWRVGIMFPLTAVFSWMVLQRWIPGKRWLELCSMLLFLLLVFFHDMFLLLDTAMGGWLWTVILEGCYAGAVFWGTVKCYEG